VTAESVPFVDLQAAHAEVAEEVRSGFDVVMSASAFMQGPDVAAFEREFARFSRVGHCVGVANGTDALELGLRASGVTAGDEVVVPANTFIATAEAVVRIGARPVFVDVDPHHLLMDPDATADAVTSRTAAVVPVHLYGQMAPMAAIRTTAERRGILVLEDAAQSQGAEQDGRSSGSVGDVAATSFYPGKNIGAYGDAGAVLTDSEEVARSVRLLANHGSEVKYRHETLGFNSRLDTLQAVVLRAKLRRLARWNELRREAAARYAELLADLDTVALPSEAPGNRHVWHLYVVQVMAGREARDAALEVLLEQGVQAQIHYPVPVHLQPAFASLRYRAGDFPVAEAAADRILSLPLFPHIAPSQQERVAEVLRKAVG
jgi:dTDP-4-amino-4,6-dideoxygalactose transaminase